VEVKRKSKEALLRLIERERDGEIVDRALIKNILDIFLEVGHRPGCGGVKDWLVRTRGPIVTGGLDPNCVFYTEDQYQKNLSYGSL
jgi:hypothetical protein